VRGERARARLLQLGEVVDERAELGEQAGAGAVLDGLLDPAVLVAVEGHLAEALILCAVRAVLSVQARVHRLRLAQLPRDRGRSRCQQARKEECTGRSSGGGGTFHETGTSSWQRRKAADASRNEPSSLGWCTESLCARALCS
jgi:hypothetical protein